jgi:AcrR family transcriptional regulator
MYDNKQVSTPKLDRRKQRTRAQLHEALLALIVEKGYDSLTIQEITERADLRRATFYMHYRDKEELLTAALTTIFDGLVRDSQHIANSDGIGGKMHVAAYLVTFKHAQQHYALYRNILSAQCSTLVAGRIRAYLASLILPGLTALEPLPMPADALANYIAGAELSMIMWWLENAMPYPAEQMAQIVHELVLNGIMSALNGRLDATLGR